MEIITVFNLYMIVSVICVYILPKDWFSVICVYEFHDACFICFSPSLEAPELENQAGCLNF